MKFIPRKLTLPLLLTVALCILPACDRGQDPAESGPDLPQNSGTADTDLQTISESQAMDLASAHWNIKTGDVDPDSGFVYRIESQGILQAPDGRSVYNVFLRWLVELPESSHYSTVENIWVDAVTGEIIIPWENPDSHVHTFGDWTVLKEATCRSIGKQERTCSCGKIESKSIAKTDHKGISIPAVAPTLTENGSANGIQCSVCSKVLVEPQIVPYIGHTDLAFGFSEGANYYAVTGRGECTAAAVYIPAYVDGREIKFITEQAFFRDEMLTALTLPETVDTIETAAFAFCTSLTELTLPNSLLELQPDAFYGCSKLTKVVLPDNVFTIHPSTFAGCTSLIDLTLPKNLITVRMYAFENCASLTSLTIPNKVQEIQSCAFRGCTSLTEVYLPAGLETLENGVFDECPALTDIYFAGTETQWNALQAQIPESVTVHVNARPR
ncbi:MAG: leucine-rich repeat domain-containing protein [Ruminococcaceae bacterium]|nr:leucine-rich repeat domain-containing protein [Oscillospiraceae bacterium]